MLSVDEGTSAAAGITDAEEAEDELEPTEDTLLLAAADAESASALETSSSDCIRARLFASCWWISACPSSLSPVSFAWALRSSSPRLAEWLWLRLLDIAADRGTADGERGEMEGAVIGWRIDGRVENRWRGAASANHTNNLAEPHETRQKRLLSQISVASSFRGRIEAIVQAGLVDMAVLSSERRRKDTRMFDEQARRAIGKSRHRVSRACIHSNDGPCRTPGSDCGASISHEWLNSVSAGRWAVGGARLSTVSSSSCGEKQSPR